VHCDFWGMGIATKAVKGYLDLYWSLPERKDINEIEAWIDVENYASQKIAQKVGAKKKEGGLLRGVVEIPGKGKRDCDVWTLSRPPFRETHES